MAFDYTEFLPFAKQLAGAGRACIRASAGAAPVPIQKGDGSPVTAVDQAVEDRLRGMIAESFPDHGIVGEERGGDGSERDFVWVLDPIDGTLPFLAGIPVYGTLIALLRQGAPVLGVIDMPATGERWIGCEGLPTTRNGSPVAVRSCAALRDALLSTSNPDFYGKADFERLGRMRAKVRWSVYGGSCMAYAQLATGRIDIGMDVGLDPFDFLALVPVIQGAGGTITDWQGKALTLQSGPRILAAGDRRIHAQALEILAAPDRQTS